LQNGQNTLRTDRDKGSGFSSAGLQKSSFSSNHRRKFGSSHNADANPRTFCAK